MGAERMSNHRRFLQPPRSSVTQSDTGACFCAAIQGNHGTTIATQDVYSCSGLPAHCCQMLFRLPKSGHHHVIHADFCCLACTAAAAALTVSAREPTSTGTEGPIVDARYTLRTNLTRPPLIASGLAASRAPAGTTHNIQHGHPVAATATRRNTPQHTALCCAPAANPPPHTCECAQVEVEGLRVKRGLADGCVHDAGAVHPELHTPLTQLSNGSSDVVRQGAHLQGHTPKTCTCTCVKRPAGTMPTCAAHHTRPAKIITASPRCMQCVTHHHQSPSARSQVHRGRTTRQGCLAPTTRLGVWHEPLGPQDAPQLDQVWHHVWGGQACCEVNRLALAVQDGCGQLRRPDHISACREGVYKHAALAGSGCVCVCV